eukprot:150912_1
MAAHQIEAPTTTFGQLIYSILTENNGKILAKYHKQPSKKKKQLEAKHEEQRMARRRAQERREMMNENHLKPNITYNAKKEKIMRKTATYGVVALFKAVAKHQRDLKRSLDEIDEDDDILEKKRMKIEQKSTNKLLFSLNESSLNANTDQLQLIETHKRRKVKHKIYKHNNDTNDNNDSDSDLWKANSD